MDLESFRLQPAYLDNRTSLIEHLRLIRFWSLSPKRCPSSLVRIVLVWNIEYDRALSQSIGGLWPEQRVRLCIMMKHCWSTTRTMSTIERYDRALLAYDHNDEYYQVLWHSTVALHPEQWVRQNVVGLLLEQLVQLSILAEHCWSTNRAVSTI